MSGINWREVFKFLSGATFVGGLTNLYLGAQNITLPFLGWMIPPWFLGVRGVVGLGLSAMFWWLGWGRK